MEEELKQEEWEEQDNFNELDIDEVLEGGDEGEDTNDITEQGE